MKSFPYKTLWGAFFLLPLLAACSRQEASLPLSGPTKILKIGVLEGGYAYDNEGVLVQKFYSATHSRLLERSFPIVGLTRGASSYNPHQPGPDRPGDFVASFATDDAKGEVTFTLKEGALFHDGTVVTARLVEGALEVFEKNNRLLLASKHVDVETLDERTIRLRGETVEAAMTLARTAFVYPADAASPLPKECGFSTVPGSGPYRFKSCDKGIIRLARWERFLPRPYFKEIQLHPYSSREALDIALLRHDVDILYPPESSLSDFLDQSRGLEHLPYLVTPCIIALTFQPDHPPLTDPRVRRAISLLIDRKAVMERSDPRAIPWAAGDAQFYWLIPSHERKRRLDESYNPAEAFRLLAEAGWERKEGRLRKGGEEFPLHISVDFLLRNYYRVAGHLMSQLNGAGFGPITIGPIQYDTLFKHPNPAQEMYLGNDCMDGERTSMKTKLIDLAWTPAIADNGGARRLDLLMERWQASRKDRLDRDHPLFDPLQAWFRETALIAPLMPMLGDLAWVQTSLGAAREAYLEDPWDMARLFRYSKSPRR